MSTSVGVNVFRWSALGLGVFYGIYHQASISARDRLAKEKHDYDHHQSLISQAKAQWAKEHPSEQPKPSGDKPSADPKDPNADLLALYGISDEK
ncbi:ATP synthase E chain-domain-containing protein [Lophiotrema nucula]|uniref:ATP synthase F(0) complex subunit e, mitochondrial n=1 Tax=Lophiotrema nucula TaxID=690887 RepID=A0A6A5YHX7_9PLEO|nr:ATP synthase E chain-domain-containing protein [Lophiotrema nucula]